MKKADSLLDESLALRARYDEEPSHSDHVALLALQIFDGLRSWHQLGARPRELLHSAALLHDIGWSQTPDGKGHNKWSAKLIQENGWKHLTRSEIPTVAQIARYHRKSPPQAAHEEFHALSASAQKTVMVLGGILRLADALDRTHTGKSRKPPRRPGPMPFWSASARRERGTPNEPCSNRSATCSSFTPSAPSSAKR